MLTIELKSKFLDLASQLSPENLSCDGELSRAKINARYRKLKGEWSQLEKQVGQQVSEDQVWDWIDEVRAYEQDLRAAAIAATPQHPLLKSSNPGVWSREGSNGMSAYYIQNSKYRGTMMLNGINLLGDTNDGFRLYSEFAHILCNKEQIGIYDTLDEAVEVAEAFLKTVTRESFKAARPSYRDENIDRELNRLPV